MRDSSLFRALIEEALTAGTVVRFRAEGTSMHPTIRNGEAITIAPVLAFYLFAQRQLIRGYSAGVKG